MLSIIATVGGLVAWWILSALFSLKVPDEGEKELLDFLTAVGGTGLNNCKAHLYTNNITPAHGDVVATYTEAAYGGYAAQTVTGWGASTLDGSNRAQSSASQVTFNNTSGSNQNVYGYYVTNSAGTKLLFAERFSGAPVSHLNGFGLGVVITFTELSEF